MNEYFSEQIKTLGFPHETFVEEVRPEATAALLFVWLTATDYAVLWQFKGKKVRVRIRRNPKGHGRRTGDWDEMLVDTYAPDLLVASCMLHEHVRERSE
jgi:hypothetical protein